MGCGPRQAARATHYARSSSKAAAFRPKKAAGATTRSASLNSPKLASQTKGLLDIICQKGYSPRKNSLKSETRRDGELARRIFHP
jgi:hypothetical protein